MTNEYEINKRSEEEWSSSLKTEFGWSARDVYHEGLGNYKVPNQIRDEIPTLNKFGYMKADIDEYGYKFIEYAATSKKKVLELGTAYGQIALKALENGANIIANDISLEHLEVLLKNTPEQYLSKLFLYPGEFPNELDFSNDSLGAVYTARMMHFLEGDVVTTGLKKIYNWLEVGGKLYFVAVSPHHSNFKEKFLHVYNDRLLAGDKWPGRIENQWEIAPQHREFVPQFLHVFDIPQLNELLPKHGFRIERISLFDYPNDTYSENKGHVGLVARKI